MNYTFIILFILIMLLTMAFLFIHFKNLSWIRRFTHPTWLPILLSLILVAMCFVLSFTVSIATTIVILYLIYAFIICEILNLILLKVLKKDTMNNKFIKNNIYLLRIYLCHETL